MTEDEKDQWMKPGKMFSDVFEITTKNALLDLYEEEFKKKYKTKPVYAANDYPAKAMLDIVKNAGDSASDLIRHFFKMNDPWFERTGHSIDTLKKSIPAINASLGKLEAKPQQGQDLKIMKQIICDKCTTYFPWTGMVSVYTSKVEMLCERCK